MDKRIYILLIVLLFGSTTFCQNSIVEKETIIRYYYDKNKVKTDTLIREYDSTGMPLFGDDLIKDHYHSIRTFTLINKVLVDSSLNKIHLKYQFTDSLVVNEETFYYPDSLVLKVTNCLPNYSSDTLTYVFITASNLSKDMINFYQRGFDNPGYQKFILKHNLLYYSAHITNIYPGSGYIDSVKYFYNKILNIRKDKSFNPDNKKWYTSKKSKYDSKSKLTKCIETEYSNYYKKYYKTRTKYNYAKNGLLISEVYYDCFYRTIESKTYYKYY